jgi:replicative DNA helicase
MKYINEEAEECLLATMVMDPSIIENVFMEISESDISSQNNKLMFLAIQQLKAKKIGIDIKSINMHLAGKVNPGKIAALADIVPSGANWQYYVREVKKHSLYRGYMEMLEEAKAYSPDNGRDITEQITEMNKTLAKLLESAGTEKIEKSMYEVMVRTEKEIDKYIENKGKMTGYKTGFRALDKYTDGIQHNLIIIGARPSIGKTALLETVLINISKLNDVPVALFEIEMTEIAIGLRAISGQANINARLIRSGKVNKEDSKETSIQMYDAMVELSSLKFYLDDKTSEIHKIASRMRYMARCLGVKVFGIDHLSIIENSNNKKPRHEQMADIIEIFRALKKELNVSIILLAQLTRTAEGEKPKLNDLRETGVAEQSADDVWMLYRDRQASINQTKIQTKLMIMKQREGPCGDIDLVFNTEIVKYFETEE